MHWGRWRHGKRGGGVVEGKEAAIFFCTGWMDG